MKRNRYFQWIAGENEGTISILDNITEYDIAKELENNFKKFGAKSLSFQSIVAINQNSALAHYNKHIAIFQV